MKEKKEFCCLLGYLIGVGVLIAFFVFCIDPFYHYHDSWFGLPVILENAVYQTAGAAKNLQYDSAIIGTSMTENFHTVWFDEELGWNTVKLSYSGARTNDLNTILEQVFDNDEPPTHIVMDINDYQLTVPAWTAYVERPEYLYDSNILTDAPYLYNYDIITLSIERIHDRIQGRESNLDTAYMWGNEAHFGKDIALNVVAPEKQQLLESGSAPADIDDMIRCCDENLNNILPFISMHPETHFYIFYPPYSMLYWEHITLQGNLREMLDVYEYSMQRFMQYSNVSLYYFQNETELISNLDNYRDDAHHIPEYNRYIFECIRDNKNLVTEDNINSYIEDMYQYAESFDYDSLWTEWEN